MCSVWVHGASARPPGGLCIFCRRQILVLATEELDCSRRGLFSTSPGRRTFLRLRGSGQQTKSSCTQTTNKGERPSRARPTSDSLPTQAVPGRPVVPLQEKGGLERPRVYRVVIGRRVSSACVSHNRRVLDARRGWHVISSAQATGTAPGPTGRHPAATGWTSRGLEFATPAASRARPPV